MPLGELEPVGERVSLDSTSCSSGLMNDSPERPATRLTLTYPSTFITPPRLYGSLRTL
jgi:hypothetical protein